MLTIESVKILVVSPNQTDREYMEAFFDNIAAMPKPHFEVNKFVPANKYDFIVFDCRSMPLYKVQDFIALPAEVQSYFFLLDRYIQDTNKYILFFGKYYHNLNYERCPAANSQFSLFARMKELIDFLNNYRTVG